MGAMSYSATKTCERGRLDDRGQRALPAHLLAAEGQPPAVEPAGAAQRGVRCAARHQPRVEVAGVRGVERHGIEGTGVTARSVRRPVVARRVARQGRTGRGARTGPRGDAARKACGTMEYVTRIVIIGGGPGGYEAALVAAQLGAEVTVVDCDGLGGASVLTDCVPSKTLIATAEVMTTFDSSYEELGIIVADDTPHDPDDARPRRRRRPRQGQPPGEAARARPVARHHRLRDPGRRARDARPRPAGAASRRRTAPARSSYRGRGRQPRRR